MNAFMQNDIGFAFAIKQFWTHARLHFLPGSILSGVFFSPCYKM